MLFCCECCVLSGRGLGDELITRPEESYRLWCVAVCNMAISTIRKPWPALGRSVTKNSWVTRDQLEVTCFIVSLFIAQHVSDVNTSILRNLRLICWVISWVVLLWFDVCWCYVVVWLGWCGICMQAEALVPQPAYGYQSNTTQEMLIHPHPYHTATAKPQRNTNTYQTRAI